MFVTNGMVFNDARVPQVRGVTGLWAMVSASADDWRLLWCATVNNAASPSCFSTCSLPAHYYLPTHLYTPPATCYARLATLAASMVWPPPPSPSPPPAPGATPAFHAIDRYLLYCRHYLFAYRLHYHSYALCLPTCNIAIHRALPALPPTDAATAAFPAAYPPLPRPCCRAGGIPACRAARLPVPPHHHTALHPTCPSFAPCRCYIAAPVHTATAPRTNDTRTPLPPGLRAKLLWWHGGCAIQPPPPHTPRRAAGHGC